MNDETKRSRMIAGAIGAAVGVAAIGAVVVVATSKDPDEQDRVSTAVVRDTAFPRVEPGVSAEPPEPKWEREPRAVLDSKPDPVVERQRALDQAKAAGLLGSSALRQGGAFASLTGTGDNIYGGLLGNEAGEMNGGFGYGRSGFGPGGGGTGWGTIGTGRYGQIGQGSGTGAGYGVGSGRGGMRNRTAGGPVVAMSTPTVKGDLDSAIVRRYLKRNIAKITYCYEKQLLVKADLQGSVIMQFVIQPNGNVDAASATGVDPTVATCIASVARAIEFPKPKGGGAVQVNVVFSVRPK